MTTTFGQLSIGDHFTLSGSSFDFGKTYRKLSPRTYSQIDQTGGLRGPKYRIGSVHCPATYVPVEAGELALRAEKISIAAFPDLKDRLRQHHMKNFHACCNSPVDMGHMDGCPNNPENMKKHSLHISGRRWFQKTYGNTYHSVRIFIDGEQVAFLPFAYGYGDQFLQTALDWLRANGHAPADAEYGTFYLRETLGGTYDVADVERKRDL